MLCPEPDANPETPLLERTAELNVMREAVRRAVSGRGAVVAVEAPAGLGKTALLDYAGEVALTSGCAVRRSSPAPLEREFPFGVVRSLFEAPVRRPHAVAAAELLRGPAGRLLLGGDAPDAAAVAGDIVRLSSMLSAARPLALLVDDAQWADGASLEVLAELAAAAGELPLVIVLAWRSDDPDARSSQLCRRRGARAGAPAAAADRDGRGDADPPARGRHAAARRACAARGIGREPVAAGRADRAGVGARRRARPARGADAARPRRGVGPRRPRVHRHRVIAVPRLVVAHRRHPRGHRRGALAPARDALRAAGLLAADRCALAHPLVCAAVAAGIAGGERRRLHREAARLLDADPVAAAGHLLQCGPQGDPEITALLLAAAERAGNGADAVGYLERALDERAPGDDRPAILSRLALAAADAELPDACERLHEALGELEDPAAREPLLRRLVALHTLTGGGIELLALLDATPGMDVAALDVLAALPGRRADRVRRLAALRSDDPAVLAHRAWAAIEVAGESAEWCADVALQALAGAPGNLLAIRTLIVADRHVEARAAIMALRASDSRDTRAAATWLAAELALRLGAIHIAEQEAGAALELAGDRLALVAAGAREVLAAALAEQGSFAEAGAIDAPRNAWRLSLAAGDYERALAQAPDEAVAAVALAHLGRREEASVLAVEAVERARRFGAPVPLLAALYARAVAEPDDDARVARCHEALAVNGCVLDLARVRLELGRTLSRQGSRLEARGALRTALDEAEAVGATPLAERARRELIATGERARRPAPGETTLTPRQRQICTLAASGKSNREIGHALFLSIKTVETHLAAAFRKLDIGSRSDLDDALTQAC